MSRRKQALFLGVLSAITLFSIAWSLRAHESVRLPERVRWGYLLGGVGLMLGFILSEAICNRNILAAMGTRRTLKQCVPFSFTGFYFSSITPSATGGQPMQVYHMAQAGIPSGQATLSLLLLSIVYQVGSLLLALLAWPLRPTVFRELDGWFGLLLGFGAITSLALTVGMILLLFRPRLCAAAGCAILGLGARLRLVKQPEEKRRRLLRQIVRYQQGSRIVRRKPLLLLKLCLLAVGQISCRFAVPYMVYRAMGFSSYSFRSFIAAEALLSMAVSFLPVPGAAGASEGVFLKTYAAMFGAGLVAPALLLSRGISFYVFLPISAVVSLFCLTRAQKRRQIQTA